MVKKNKSSDYRPPDRELEHCINYLELPHQYYNDTTTEYTITIIEVQILIRGWHGDHWFHLQTTFKHTRHW